MLDELLTDVMAGTSRVTVLRGDAGVGKSALLGYLSHRVRSCQVATAVGMESEMELAYSSLHQLCAPMLDHLDLLPMRQRDALSTVFGLGVGAVPDRFLAVIFASKVSTSTPRFKAKSNSHLVACPIRAQYPAQLGSLTASHGQPFPLNATKPPSQSLAVLAFQAGHASSILVTRSTTST